MRSFKCKWQGYCYINVSMKVKTYLSIFAAIVNSGRSLQRISDAFLCNKTRVSFLIVIMCICADQSYAEMRDSVSHRTKRELLRDTIAGRNKADLLDLAKIIIGFKRDPFHKQKLTEAGPFYNTYALLEYSQVTGFFASATFDISYRPLKNKEGNKSFVFTNLEYTQYNQTILVSLSTFYTNDNKWQFPGEVRYFNFPTTTYGLGTSSPASAADGIDYSHFRFYRSFLRRVVLNTFLGMGYNLDYRWKITDNDQIRGISNDWVKYGFSKTSTSSGPCFSFIYDTRDNPNQCIDGTYVNFQFVSHLKPLGSNNNWNSLLLEMRKFIPLTRVWYTEVAFWGYVWLTLNGKPPYLDLPSNGWDEYNNTGREYVAGRYRGLNMLYFETEFRFDILRNGLLGGVVFGNLETFTEPNGNFFGPIQPGGGAGLRIKFNKNTRSNVCLDYGFGSHHSNGFADNINEVF